MKHVLALAWILVSFAVLSAHTKDEFREEYCKNRPEHIKANLGDNPCLKVECTNGKNPQMRAVGCALARCPGETTGYKEDLSLPYPKCCKVPICGDSIKSEVDN